MSGPPFAGRERRPAAGLAVAALLGLLLACSPGQVEVRLAPRLPVVEAERTPLEQGYAWQPPADRVRALVRIGSAPTPASVVNHVQTRRFIVVSLYESLGTLTLLIIDKRTATVRPLQVPGTQLTYAMLPDAAAEDVLWVATSLAPRLLRVDLAAGRLETLAEIEGETHLFGLDQGPDGSLYAGTYPGALCLRVRATADGAEVETIPRPESLAPDRHYLHDLAVAGTDLWASFGAPAVLERYDLETGTWSRVAESEAHPWFGITRSDRGLVASLGSTERLLAPAAGPSARAEPEPVEIESRGFEAVVTWPGGRATVSLRPRTGGMNVTALGATGVGRLVGGTYWNHWVFELDPERRTVIGTGALPEASGEFFTFADLGGVLLIPNYQGDLYRYELRPGAPGPVRPPVRIADVPQAHFGWDCVVQRAGDAPRRLLCATEVNYHHASGMVYATGSGGEILYARRLPKGLTLGHLVELEGTVYGASLGRPRLPTDRPLPRVVELDAEGGVRRWVTLGERRGKDVAGLHRLGPGRLLAGVTTGDLTEITVTPDSMRARPLDSLGDFDERLTALERLDEERFLLLSRRALFSWSEEDGLDVLFRLPRMDRMVVTRACDVFLAREGDLYLLDRSLLEPGPMGCQPSP